MHNKCTCIRLLSPLLNPLPPLYQRRRYCKVLGRSVGGRFVARFRDLRLSSWATQTEYNLSPIFHNEHANQSVLHLPRTGTAAGRMDSGSLSGFVVVLLRKRNHFESIVTSAAQTAINCKFRCIFLALAADRQTDSQAFNPNHSGLRHDSCPGRKIHLRRLPLGRRSGPCGSLHLLSLHFSLVVLCRKGKLFGPFGSVFYSISITILNAGQRQRWTKYTITTTAGCPGFVERMQTRPLMCWIVICVKVVIAD